MAKTGRPTKFTPAVRKTILTAIADGNTRTTAAALAGVDYSQLKRWLRNGRKSDEELAEFRAFRAALKRADAQAIAERVKSIRKAQNKSWTAAAWWLERRYPEDWSLKAEDIARLFRQVRELEEALKKYPIGSESETRSIPTTTHHGERGENCQS